MLPNSECGVVIEILKLVFLEWSERKSDGIWIQHVEKPPCVQIFEAIGVWQHIAIIAWWHVQVIFNSIQFNSFLCHIISKKFPCNIITWILIEYPTIDFFILVLEIAAQNYACSIWYNSCCFSKSHALVIKRKIAIRRHWLPQLLQKSAQGGFSTYWIQICHPIYSLTTPGIQAITFMGVVFFTGIIWRPIVINNTWVTKFPLHPLVIECALQYGRSTSCMLLNFFMY